MAKKDLIVDDEYCTAMGKYFEKQGEELDKLIVEYIEVLQNIKSTAIVKGEVSKALKVYIEYVKKMKNQLGSVSKNANNQVSSFLNRIDTEDQYLF